MKAVALFGAYLMIWSGTALISLGYLERPRRASVYVVPAPDPSTELRTEILNAMQRARR